MKMFFLVLFSAFSLALSAGEEAGVQYVVLDNGYRVWTKRVGHGPIQILTLHGGPGCTHEYLECLADYLPPDRFQLIFYDQLGSYHSDQPDDLSLWTMERFKDEVEQVRKALGLEDFYLFGQSWGSMLAMDYAIEHQHHLKGLILSNMTAGIPSYERYIAKLRANLPQSVQDRLTAFEERGDFFNPAYEKIMFEEVYIHHLCRIQPWPESLTRALSHWNPKPYHTMQGPNEFVITGNFKQWDRWADLPNIDVPTLVIGGRFDTMNPDDILEMGRLLPQGKAVICEKGSHLAMMDDAESYFKALLEFFEN